MNYKVLYRKYRPNDFDEIIGQDNVVEILKDSVINDRLSHAYIFSGPRGTGKTSTAKILAKAINCTNITNGNPCKNCANCLNFQNNADIYEIDAASNNGVDQIREIIENIKLTPIQSRYKIYIIDEVHMLSTNAFNALLLTLEEPPSHVIFILATTNVEEVPITVLSRCQRLDFRKISSLDIEKNIERICELEKIEIEEAAAREIAEFSEGGMRDALSILDQLSKGNSKIDLDVVLENIGLVSTKQVETLLDEMTKNNADYVSNFIEKAKNLALDYKTIVKKIINESKKRAILSKKVNEKERYKNYKQLCFELSNTIYKNNINLNSFDIMELILLDYLTEDDSEETSAKSVEIKPEKAEENNRIIDIRVNNCFVNASKEKLAIAKNNWKHFLSELQNLKIKGIIQDCNVVLASDDILVLSTEFQETEQQLFELIIKIEQEFENIIGSKIKLAVLYSKKWDKFVETYKQNLKNNVKYKYIDEENYCLEINDDVFSKKIMEIK